MTKQSKTTHVDTSRHSFYSENEDYFSGAAALYDLDSYNNKLIHLQTDLANVTKRKGKNTHSIEWTGGNFIVLTNCATG